MLRSVLIFLCIFMTTNTYANVLFIGDSLTGVISTEYIKLHPDVTVDVDFVVGSGLENKTIDWFKKVEHIDFTKYSYIVISFGTNDFISANKSQPIIDRWQYNYLQKIGRFINYLRKYTKPKIVWIAPPTIKNNSIDNGVSLARDTILFAARYFQFEHIDVRETLGYEFRYSVDGIKIRTADGIHYTSEAGKMISNLL